MSLEFKSLKVEDYFSLSQATLEYKPGIYLVEGENRDLPNFESLINSGASTSNGSGKTTLFSAPYQCLFNKNSKDSKASISNVGNIYTNKPYNITLKFSKEGKNYLVNNNRNHNKIMISEDGKNITPKGVANQLTILRNIVGFDFNTFSSLTFLNQQALSNIIDLTNKDNIVYQFFDIERLNKLEKDLKVKRKSRIEDRTLLLSNLSVVNKHLTLVEGFVKVDIDNLRRQELDINNSIAELQLKEGSPKIKVLNEKISTIKSDLEANLVKQSSIEGAANVLKRQAKSLEKGVCPTCNQDVKGKSADLNNELDGYRTSYKEISTDINTNIEARGKLTSELNKELSSIQKEKTEAIKQLNIINTKIILAEDNNTKYDSAKDNIASLQEEYDLLQAEAPLIDSDIKVIESLLAVLKSGAVVNEYLKKYRLLFTRNFRDLKKYTSFDIDIIIKVEKGKMSYNFFDAGKEKSFTSLSAGERTRVSLMLLLATLSTIEQLTNITLNYLVLDELLGVLDYEGILFLKKVLDDMRKTKSIYIITHHNEIEEDYADGIIKVVRDNNLSTVEEE